MVTTAAAPAAGAGRARPAPVPLAAPARRAFRLAGTLWLAGWFWKAGFFAEYFRDEALAYPVTYAGLPPWLEHPAVAVAAWLCPALAAIAVAWPRRALARAAAILMAVASFVACVHLETCSDATFLTSFWAALWLVWLAHNGHRTDASFTRHARLLARSVVALMFLGAFAGKLTPEYTSGEAFHNLYFLTRDEWPYPALRASLEPERLREVATWSSRGAIAIEGLTATIPLWPHRPAVLFAIAVMLAMIGVTTFYLVSVLACLAGVCAAALVFSAPRARAPAARDGGDAVAGADDARERDAARSAGGQAVGSASAPPR